MIRDSLKVELSHLRPWSFSKVQKAKKCQYDFFFRYVEKIEPIEKAEFLVTGNGVHFVLENALNTVFRRKKPLGKDLLFYFLELYKRNEPEVNEKKVVEFFPNIVRFVNGQLRRTSNSRVLAAELEIAIDTGFNIVENFGDSSVFLRGKLDFVFSRGDTLYIVDHKTNRSRDFNNRIKTQLRWYALLASVKFPQFKHFALEVHNVRYGTVNRFIFTESDLKSFKLRILPIIEILEEEFAGKGFDELIPSPCEVNCKWCDYRHVCPAASP